MPSAFHIHKDPLPVIDTLANPSRALPQHVVNMAANIYSDVYVYVDYIKCVGQLFKLFLIFYLRKGDVMDGILNDPIDFADISEAIWSIWSLA